MNDNNYHELLRSIIGHIKRKGGARVTSDEISDIFDIRETTTGNFNTRKIIKDAMRLYGEAMAAPIGADGKGYYLITSPEQLQEYLDNLQGRITGIQERIDIVKNSWEKTNHRPGYLW